MSESAQDIRVAIGRKNINLKTNDHSFYSNKFTIEFYYQKH